MSGHPLFDSVSMATLSLRSALSLASLLVLCSSVSEDQDTPAPTKPPTQLTKSASCRTKEGEFSRLSDKKRHKCRAERIEKQQGAVRCSQCQRKLRAEVDWQYTGVHLKHSPVPITVTHWIFFPSFIQRRATWPIYGSGTLCLSVCPHSICFYTDPEHPELILCLTSVEFDKNVQVESYNEKYLSWQSQAIFVKVERTSE